MNDHNVGTTECDHDKVPPVEVIQVGIKAKFLDAIKLQIIEKHPELENEVRGGKPVMAFIALPGNRVIAASSEDNVTFVPGPDNKFVPQSLIPIALFVGEGSNTTGCSVGSKTEYIEWA